MEASTFTTPAVGFEPRSGDTWRDPFAMYAALRDHDPVHRVRSPGGDYWVLSRFDDVFAAVRDTATFSSAQGLTFTYGERERIGLDTMSPLVMMDPPEHTAFRRLVATGFTPRHVAEIEPAVRSFVVERLEGLRDRAGWGSSTGMTVDIVAELFKPLPSFVVAEYLGVPPEDRPRFDSWTDRIVAANAQGDPMIASAAVGELFDYFADLVERRRVDPSDDVISALVHADVINGLQGVEDGLDQVSLLEIVGFAFTMITGGNDTTTGLLGGAAELLTRAPEQRVRLLLHPELIPGAVEELLRLTCPVQGLARTTTRAVELHGTEIPEGSKVLLLYASANRDPRRFGPDAEELDVTRDAGQILTFGYGAHHCLGAAAARLQGRVALTELLARYPGFTVGADEGRFAPGHFVRRYESLPFRAGGSW